jgi:hypothetical protein
MTAAGDPKPLPPSPCPLGPYVWYPTHDAFSPMTADSTEMLWPDGYGLPPAPAYPYNPANPFPLQFPFTIDILIGTKWSPPVEMVEVESEISGGYEVIRGMDCKDPGDWPYGGDGSIYEWRHE